MTGFTISRESCLHVTFGPWVLEFPPGTQYREDVKKTIISIELEYLRSETCHVERLRASLELDLKPCVLRDKIIANIDIFALKTL